MNLKKAEFQIIMLNPWYNIIEHCYMSMINHTHCWFTKATIYNGGGLSINLKNKKGFRFSARLFTKYGENPLKDVDS